MATRTESRSWRSPVSIKKAVSRTEHGLRVLSKKHRINKNLIKSSSMVGDEVNKTLCGTQRQQHELPCSMLLIYPLYNQSTYTCHYEKGVRRTLTGIKGRVDTGSS